MYLDAKHLIDRIKQKNKDILTDKSEVGVTSMFVKTTVNEASRELAGMATTDDMDCDKEVVLPSALDLSYLVKNKQLFLDHEYDFAHNIGVLRSIAPRPTLNDVKGFFLRFHVYNKENPFCNDILTVAREAGQIGLSIAFEANTRSRPTADEAEQYNQNGIAPLSVVRKAKVIEVSVTAMPCNISCQASLVSSSAKAIEKAKATLDELVTKGKISLESARAFGLTEEKRNATNKKRIIFL